MPSATNSSQPALITERAIDSVRPIKVIYIGAGVSGIISGIRLPEKISNLDLTIYDKNPEVGGTWWENRYPGCACGKNVFSAIPLVSADEDDGDIPAHVYQLSFESNPEWSSFYASAPEILEYWKKVVAKYDVRKYMKLGHEAREARWDEENKKWRVKLQVVDTGEVIEDTADVLMAGIGALNDWKWPDIPGLKDFKGELMHSATWDDKFDHKGKRVAVIGAGSSGIQIVPSLQPHVSRLDHYVRGRTWIATTIVGEEVQKRNQTGSNFDFTDEEIEAWKKDPALYLAYRKRLEAELQGAHIICMKDSVPQIEMRKFFIQLMKDRLAKKPEVAEHMIPDFPPLCKRLTPGPGYLEALTQDNVDVIPQKIAHIGPHGITTEDGKYREIDALVCATGFDTSHRHRFPIYGRDGLKLGTKWHDRPETYLSVATSDFPNYFISLGPNAGLGAGNLLILLERMAEYSAQCVYKMQLENISTMTVKDSAVQNFTNYCEEYFKRTVFSEECSSWYKSAPEGASAEYKKKHGRVSALWPGSSLHAVKALENPRWEDFDYEYVDGNPFGWFGNGWSEADADEKMDRAYYLDGTNMIYEPAQKRGNGVADEMKERIENGDKAGTGSSVPPREGPIVQAT